MDVNGHYVSTTLENEAIATVENEATQTDWRVITLEDWALIRRLAAEGVPKAADRAAVGDLADDGDQGGEVGCAAEV